MPGFNSISNFIFDVCDPDLDLKRNYFLEASAGTGKTYTIEQIVIRLIEQGLQISQILLVTFTRAATIELKLRIRSSLEKKCAANKESLVLARALAEFDTAHIFTIHSFCFHQLKECALWTGFSLNQQAESVGMGTLENILKDFFTAELDPNEIHPRQLEKIIKKYQSPEKLFASLIKPTSCPTASRSFQDVWSEIDRERTYLSCDPFFSPINKERLIHEFIQAASRFGGLCDRKRQLKQEHLGGIARFVSLLQGEEVNPIDLPCIFMVPDNLIRNQTYPEWMEKLSPLIALLAELSNTQLIMDRLSQRAQDYVTTVCAQEDLFFYDDLLKRMDTLKDHTPFCEHVRSKYRAVLIDEFQDTDRLQWSIFSHLFLGHAYLYLVGDPKQSIYRFRGADLYTYMEAKAALGPQAYATLNCNYRSQAQLVESLNTLFSRTEHLITLPKIDSTIPIPPMIAALPEKGSAGVVFCQAEKEADLFSYILHEIVRLHHEENIPLIKCAVLVKDRYQAKRFISQCSLPYVDWRSESVAESHACVALEDLLWAIYQPRDRNRVVKVLGGPLFQIPITELKEQIELKAPVFFRYQKTLFSKGVLSLLEMIQTELVFPTRAFYLDFLQLIELLAQQVSNREEYLSYLLKLKEQDPDSEALKARAKADEDAVQIMTLHMSKGLEFDAVFPVGLACNIEMGDEEERSEKMRQLYVALTRAKRFLYLPVLEGKSPLNHFLSQALQGESVPSFVASHPHFSLVTCKHQAAPLYVRHNKNEVNTQKTKHSFYFPPCTIESFTSLAEKKEIFWEGEKPSDAMPSGIEVGLILHKVFENVNFHTTREELTPFVSRQLEKTLLRDWCTQVENLIWDTLHYPLPCHEGFLRLSEIDPGNMIREMEFLYLARISHTFSGNSNTLKVDLAPRMGEAVLTQHCPRPSAGQSQPPEVRFTPKKCEKSGLAPQGFLKGFIDLFFEYKGKFYLIDWKTNFLERYDPQSLREVIEAYQYNVQAAIYSQAARNYLKLFQREKDFGGIYYLFLRGLNKKNNEGVHFLDCK